MTMKTFFMFIILITFTYAKENVTLQLNWLHQFQFAGYYIAKEKGYYKDVGINVNIKEFQYGLNLLSMIEDKKVDFTIGRSSLLIDKAKGKDIVALFAAFQNSPLILLVKEDSNIKTLEDFKNKKVMITSHASDTASILAMLSSKKMSLDDITIQKHSFDINDLINNKTDAMASYISNEPIILEDKKIKYKIFHSKDYGFEFYSDILFTSATFIKNNEELTKNFYEATKKGWEYAFNNIGKTAEIIYNNYNTQNKSLVHLVAEGEALKKLAYTQNKIPLGNISKDKLQRIVDVYKVLGLMNKDIDLENFVYEHNYQRTLDIKLTEKEIIIYVFIAILLVLLLLITLIFIFVRRRWLHTTNHLEEEIKFKTQQLEKQTYLDILTGANNRKAYNEKIKEHMSLFNRYGHKFSFIMMDIDNFKHVNDTYGHKIGDKVLIELVNIVNSRIRVNDFLFRVGGEEFVIILAEIDFKSAKLVAEDIRKSIEDELTSSNNETVTVSIGLTEVKSNDTEDLIFTRADELLYRSKEEGKNRISF